MGEPAGIMPPVFFFAFFPATGRLERVAEKRAKARRSLITEYVRYYIKPSARESPGLPETPDQYPGRKAMAARISAFQG